MNQPPGSPVWPPSGRGHLRGRVTAFHREAGLGEIRTEDAGLLPFHCTEIADGSRDVAVGAEVDLVVSAGHLGRWEARTVVPQPRARL